MSLQPGLQTCEVLEDFLKKDWVEQHFLRYKARDFRGPGLAESEMVFVFGVRLGATNLDYVENPVFLWALLMLQPTFGVAFWLGFIPRHVTRPSGSLHTP